MSEQKRTTIHRTCFVFLITAAALIILSVGATDAGAQVGISETGEGPGAIYPPPATGTYAYGTSDHTGGFVLANTVGASYVDPVFGTTVQRVTNDNIHEDIYARNMWWNADETRFFHRGKIINVATNTVEYSGVPTGDFTFDAGFDPVDPNAFYYLSGSSLHKITLQSGGTWSDVVYWTTPGGASFKSLGGTLNWLDASGRYMVVRYGSEPSVHVLDRQNLAAGPYANAVDGASTIGQGHYVGITPDGQYLVGYQNGGPYCNNPGQGVSWSINHATRTIAASPTVFWSLAGDHASILSASDGRNYMVVGDVCGVDAPIVAQMWAVDITNNADGLTETQQRALPNNKLLRTWDNWDESDYHVTTVAKGPLQDWAFVSTEDTAIPGWADPPDSFDSGTAGANNKVTPWHSYRQEIIAFNIITGERRRIAHHRSRSICSFDPCYFYSPRPSASWTGKWVGFSSNFDQNLSHDIYAVQFSGFSGPAQNVVWTNLVNVTATGNSLQKTGGCNGCFDAGATSQQQIASGNGYVQFTAGETNTMRSAGLGNGNTNTTRADIEFAISLWENGTAEVYESDTYKCGLGSYTTGTVFKVSVEGGVVKYYKDGILGCTSGVAPTYPLVLDTSLWSANSTINNAVISTGP